MKLYEITEIHNNALLAMSDIEGLDEAVINDTLESLEGDFKTKAISVAGYFQNIDAEISAMKDAEKRISERRKAKEKEVTSLKQYLLSNMQRTGITKIECPEFKISIRNNAESVNVINESLIPSLFKTISTTETIDKRSIKEAGGCPGVELVRNQSLIIK